MSSAVLFVSAIVCRRLGINYLAFAGVTKEEAMATTPQHIAREPQPSMQVYQRAEMLGDGVATGTKQPTNAVQHSSIRAPVLHPCGTILPLPSKKNKYTKIETNTLAIIHRNKTAVVNAILKSGCKPGHRALYAHFPKANQLYDAIMVKALLKDFEVGNAEWKERVDLIARFEHGPCTDTIYAMCNYFKDQHSDSIEDDELTAINASISDVHSPPMTGEQESRTVVVSPDAPSTCTDITEGSPSLPQVVPMQVSMVNDTSSSTPASVLSPIRSNACSCSDGCSSTNVARPIPIRTSASTAASAQRLPATSNVAASVSTHKRKAASLDEEVVDIDADDSLDKMANDALKFVFTLVSQANPKMKRSSIESMSEKVLAKCLDISSSNTYIRVPQIRALSPTASDASKKEYLRKKVKQSKEIMASYLPDDETNAKVLQTLVGDFGLFVCKKEDMLIDIKEIVTLRDLADMSTNAIYRFKSGFEALHPLFKGLIFPSMIKAKLGEFEGSDNLSINAKMHKLVVSKDGMKEKLCAHMYLEEPHKLVELLKDSSVMDGTYQASETFMKKKGNQLEHKGKDAFTFQTDKSADDINTSIKTINRSGGNSQEHTHIVCCTSGGACEDYDNLKQTVYNHDYPTQPFLQGLLDDRYHMITINITGRQCQSFMFMPTPSIEEACNNRPFHVQLLQFDSIVESEGLFADLDASAGGPPEINIPLDVQNLFVRFVKSKGDDSVAVGFQLLIGHDVIHTQQFRTPMLLVDVQHSDISTTITQVVGFPANDGKQQHIISGNIHCAGICLCTSCTCQREYGGIMSSRLWGLHQQHHGVQGPAFQDPPKREGDMSFVACAERYDKETMGGAMRPTKKQKREITITCGNVTKPPLLITPAKKNNMDPLHVSAGTANHGLEEMRKEIREVEDDEQFMVNARLAKVDMDKLQAQLELTRPKALVVRNSPLSWHPFTRQVSSFEERSQLKRRQLKNLKRGRRP